MESYREQKPVNFTEFNKCVLKRTKIEQWVDEPFFRDALIVSYNERQRVWKETDRDPRLNGGVYVKVGLGARKYVVAEIREIKDDAKFQYKLTNGRMCGIRLRLQLKKDEPSELKWFKIT